MEMSDCWGFVCSRVVVMEIKWTQDGGEMKETAQGSHYLAFVRQLFFSARIKVAYKEKQ